MRERGEEIGKLPVMIEHSFKDTEDGLTHMLIHVHCRALPNTHTHARTRTHTNGFAIKLTISINIICTALFSIRLIKGLRDAKTSKMAVTVVPH